MSKVTTIAPCFWFDDQAEEAARFYTGIFPNSTIVATSRYTDVGREFHGKPCGSIMTVEFTLDGNRFTALNGGPMFKFNEAMSLQVFCETQREIDAYWLALTAGGDPKAQQCGWLKDRFGVSWQILPSVMQTMMVDPDVKKIERVMTALFTMKKLDIAELETAYRG
ncbi:VOC family protein [Variovorax sp. VNK109]|jgi:predicted 3-demethylubiquinone-9 3-methyltransferase (glyoxalase superfamily)|uniref:VOC family protein n=1 Tax=Variovorax sp. VNK109 TaxID=3400919 RepID=UPI003C104FED